MKPKTRFINSTTLTLAVLTASLMLLQPAPLLGQSSSGIARKAIGEILSPATGSKALERSCKRISAALASYVKANKPDDWNDQAVDPALNDISKLEAKIEQLDNAENIEAFMRHTLEFLLRYPESSTFPQRLWKLAAITELTERVKTSRILTRPFLPALLNACAMLPPDNPFNLEGKFLAARHYRQTGQPEKEENLLRDLLKRPRLTREAKYTVKKLLGSALESQERFAEAIKLYVDAGRELKGFPQSIDMVIRGALLQLESGNKNQALELIQGLNTPPGELIKLTAAPKIHECLIRLSSEESSLIDYWKHSDRWWKKWVMLRDKLGHERPADEKRLPDLGQVSNIEQTIATAVASRDDEKFHDTLDLLMHALRWCPCIIDQAGPALCFFATRIHPDQQRSISELTIEICRNLGPEGSPEKRSAVLYQTICYSDTENHSAAVELIEEFRETDTANDALSETMHRLWAHLAIAGHTAIDGPRKALEEILYDGDQTFNRAQTVLYLARIYRSLKLEEKEKSLLKKELTHAEIRDNTAVVNILQSRYSELTEDKIANSRLSQAAAEWITQCAPDWLQFTLPEGLNDPRVKDTGLLNALNTPQQSSITPDESVKLQLLAAASEDIQLSISTRAFYAAFASLYSSSPTHSTARKMLRSVLRDDRFPKQLQEIVLAYAMDEALSRQRKREITSAITHPIFNNGSDNLRETGKSYAIFANSDLLTRDGLRQSYKLFTAKSINQSRLNVITAVFEKLLNIGELDEAAKLLDSMPSWTMDPKVGVNRKALKGAFSSSLDRATRNIAFARSMHGYIKDSFPLSDTSSITTPSDYRKEIDLKRLPEKEGFNLLLDRARSGNTLEKDPQFWMDLAELMPRGGKQVEFSFFLVENLLKSSVGDLEKSYALFAAPSIIDTDNPMLLSRLLDIFKKHQDKASQPNSYAAIQIVVAQSRDLRQGNPINLDNAWNNLDHPALQRILNSSKISQFMARRTNDELLKQLRSMPDKELFSPSLIDVTWPALILSGMREKADQAGAAVRTLTPSLISGAARNLDFYSIRLVYAAAKRLNSPDLIPENWLDCLDRQIRSERDRYSLRIIDAEFREDWKEVLKWSTKAVTEYPTYYNYYRPHGIALHKTGQAQKAIHSLEVYTKYSHDEIHWQDAVDLLNKLKSSLD